MLLCADITSRSARNGILPTLRPRAGSRDGEGLIGSVNKSYWPDILAEVLVRAIAAALLFTRRLSRA
jgi:hypothetical protein